MDSIEQEAEAAAGPATTSRANRALGRLRAAVVLALLLPALAYALVAAILYQRAFSDARASLDRAARVAAEHALKLFDTNEMLLQRMRDLIGDRSDAELLQDGVVLHERLRRMASTLPQVQGLYVFGADSRMVATSRIHPSPRNLVYTDRPWFPVHRRGAVHTFFTEQIVSRLTGEAAFDMSQRRSHPDGSFAGTLHVSLRPEYLTDFYKDLAQSDPSLRVTVLRDDGALIARWPTGSTQLLPVPASDPLMKQIANGVRTGIFDGPSPWDGTMRLSTFRKLGELPLYVVGSTDRTTVVNAWAKSAAVLAVFVFPTAIGFAWMAWVALARTRDELESVRRLGDETARRQRAELGLMRSQKLEAIGRLTGGVAHDFNNLLAVVGNSLEVLRRQHPSVAGTRQVEAIDRAVGSGVRLTRQLLAFARTQAVLPERLRLQDRHAGLVELLRPLLGSSIQLDSKVAPDTSAIEVDIVELELALINIAINAADAMLGRGSLSLSARNARPYELPSGMSGDFVLLDVDDSGPGIDDALAARVFEPFFTTKAVGKGTGLGLSQVRSFCRSTGGDALIMRTSDGGTRVRLLLRRSDGPAPEAAPPELPVSPLQARVLLVEDNAEVASAMAELLSTLGCEVRMSPDALSAMRLLETQTELFDVVLSDIEMPGSVDGIELAEWVRRTQPDLPVILMTGYAPRLEQATRQLLTVLPKPCSAAVLAEVLRKAMEAPRESAA